MKTYRLVVAPLVLAAIDVSIDWNDNEPLWHIVIADEIETTIYTSLTAY